MNRLSRLAGGRKRAERFLGSREDLAPRTFLTRQVDDPPEMIRTHGVVVATRPGCLNFSEKDALRQAPPVHPGDWAHGKVAALARVGVECQAVCYQLSDCNTRARRVACCNATAATAAFHAALAGREQFSMRLRLQGSGRIEVAARVRETANGLVVDQIWNQIPFLVHEPTGVDGRSGTVCVSPLNHYLILQTRSGEDVSEVPIEVAFQAWRQLGLEGDPLLSRIAVVQTRRTIPRVKFFTCGVRDHPSAPPTGLAVMALIGQRLGWNLGNSVETRTGVMTLPRVRLLANGAAQVEFRPVVVCLAPQLKVAGR